MPNIKITGYTAIDAVADADLFEVVDDAAGTPTSRKCTAAQIRTGLQAALVSGTNIKTINGTTILGSGDLAVAGGAWGGITGTLSSQTDLQTALNLKANLAAPTFTGAWDLRGGYGAGGMRPFADAGLGQVGFAVHNYGGTAVLRAYGTNAGGGVLELAGNDITGSANYISSKRFHANDANGGAASAPLFAMDIENGLEGGFYKPVSGGVAGNQIWCSSRTDRLSLTRAGLFIFHSGLIQLDSLPTADPAIAGRIWNDANTLKISTGA